MHVQHENGDSEITQSQLRSFMTMLCEQDKVQLQGGIYSLASKT